MEPPLLELLTESLCTRILLQHYRICICCICCILVLHLCCMCICCISGLHLCCICICCISGLQLCCIPGPVTLLPLLPVQLLPNYSGQL